MLCKGFVVKVVVTFKKKHIKHAQIKGASLYYFNNVTTAVNSFAPV